MFYNLSLHNYYGAFLGRKQMRLLHHIVDIFIIKAYASTQ